MMEPEVLSQLMRQHAAALMLFARQFCASPEDVVQEAFVSLSRQCPRPTNILSWLYRVVRNGAISAARKEERRRKHETNAAREADWLYAPDQTALDAEEVSRALQSLPLNQREVVVAHLWSELSFVEIAELIGASSSTAHRLYHAGLDTLRERLQVSCRIE